MDSKMKMRRKWDQMKGRGCYNDIYGLKHDEIKVGVVVVVFMDENKIKPIGRGYYGNYYR